MGTLGSCNCRELNFLGLGYQGPAGFIRNLGKLTISDFNGGLINHWISRDDG